MIDLSKGIDPSSQLGLLFLVLGLFFSCSCIYVLSSLNEESIEDQKRNNSREEERAKKIARLYPKKN